MKQVTDHHFLSTPFNMYQLIQQRQDGQGFARKLEFTKQWGWTIDTGSDPASPTMNPILNPMQKHNTEGKNIVSLLNKIDRSCIDALEIKYSFNGVQYKVLWGKDEQTSMKYIHNDKTAYNLQSFKFNNYSIKDILANIGFNNDNKTDDEYLNNIGCLLRIINKWTNDNIIYKKTSIVPLIRPHLLTNWLLEAGKGIYSYISPIIHGCKINPGNISTFVYCQ